MKLYQVALGALACALSIGVACAGPPIITFNGGGTPIGFNVLSEDLTDYVATPDKFSYAAAGSAAGQNAFLDDDIGYFEPVSGANPEGYAPGTSTYGTVGGTAVDFAGSDEPLSSSQISSYGLESQDGPLIQFPGIVVPVALAYNVSPAESLTLTDAQLCGVLSGQITDFNALNPLIPPGTTINVVVPANGNGTTYWLTQHLNAVCTASNSAFPEYPVPVTPYFYNSPGATSPVFPSGLPTNFSGAPNTASVASTLTSTSNSLGYLTPDYTSIAPSAPNTTSLQVASLVNSQNSVAYLPTVANTGVAVNHPGPGATDTAPPATMAAAMNQENWTPAMPQPSKGYSIIGLPLVLMSSCYNVPAAPHLLGAMRKIISNETPYAGNATNSGFVPLQSTTFGKAYGTAINQIFLGNQSGYGLDINDSTTCASYPGR